MCCGLRTGLPVHKRLCQNLYNRKSFLLPDQVKNKFNTTSELKKKRYYLLYNVRMRVESAESLFFLELFSFMLAKKEETKDLSPLG